MIPDNRERERYYRFFARAGMTLRKVLAIAVHMLLPMVASLSLRLPAVNTTDVVARLKLDLRRINVAAPTDSDSF